MDLATLSAAHFAPCLHGTFYIEQSAIAPGADAPALRTFDLELTEVDEFGQPAPADHRPGFLLVFLGAPSPHYLPQRVYTLRHATMPALELFLTPIGPAPGAADRMRYQAVFN